MHTDLKYFFLQDIVSTNVLSSRKAVKYTTAPNDSLEQLALTLMK